MEKNDRWNREREGNYNKKGREMGKRNEYGIRQRKRKEENRKGRVTGTEKVKKIKKKNEKKKIRRWNEVRLEVKEGESRKKREQCEGI